jgi:spore germination protein GerM
MQTTEKTVKRFHLPGYLLLLICLAMAGVACSSASNTTSETKTETAPTQTPISTTGTSPVAAPATGATSTPGAAATPEATSTPGAMTEAVKVYLVAVNDKGKKGKKIGCDDSLIPITRKIKPTDSPLKAAIEELLAIPHEYSKELGNYWWGKNLKLKSVSITDGVATIQISGEGPFVAGVCDEPRITEQIEETAKQFPTVKSVKVFVNDRTLKEAIR